MEKIVFILNGRAGSGKDTFVSMQKEYALKKYGIKIINISTVDLVKEAAKLLGWDGTKNPTSRKFLSDLKDLSTSFCDAPAKYCYEVAESLQDDCILYIHCREPHEIEKMKQYLSYRMRCYTVLIKRDSIPLVTSNHADAEVEKYNYDIEVDNNSTVENFSKRAERFVDDIVSWNDLILKNKSNKEPRTYIK